MNFNKKLKDDLDQNEGITPDEENMDDKGVENKADGKKEKKKDDDEKSEFPNKK